MRIVFFRHGPAGRRDASSWPDDGLRPLTDRGRRRTAAAARGLSRLERNWTAILTSPLSRARQTAEIAGGVLRPEGGIETVEALAPGGDRRETWRRVRKFAPGARLVLVGHEPDLGALAGELAFGTGVHVPLRKAGACCVRIDDELRVGSGAMEWILLPRILRRLGRRKGRAC